VTPCRTTLSRTVSATAATARPTTSSFRPSSSTASRREHDGRESARPEPAEEQDARAVETRPGQRDGDREHPHHGQAGDRVAERPKVEVLEGDGDERRAEEEPHDQPQELATELGQLPSILEVDDVLVERRSEGDACHERGDEPVAAEHERRAERTERGRQRGDLAAAHRDPACLLATEIAVTAAKPTNSPATTPSPSSWMAAPASNARGLGGRSDLAGRDREHQDDDRGRDAVVEPALDVERPPQPGGMRSSSITATLSAASVGASAAPTKPASAQGNPTSSNAAANQPRPIDSTSPMASRRPGKPQVAPQITEVHPGGVGEEHQREGDLRGQVE
jgi:hypothetical protein